MGPGLSANYYDDYYDVLNVPLAADAAAIRAAFCSLIRQCHPDCAEQPGSRDQASKIIKAYKTLSHPERRQQYDRRRINGPIPAGVERRSRDRRRAASGQYRVAQNRRCTDRVWMTSWRVTIGIAVLVVGVTFWPDLQGIHGDISRDILRALI